MFWFALATPLTVVALSLGLAFPHQYTAKPLTGKFTLLGLIAAVTSLQYTEWRQNSDSTWTKVFDIDWMVRALRLDDRAKSITNDSERADLSHDVQQVQGWYEGRIGSLNNVLDNVRAPARFVLTALATGLYFLCLSSVSDLAGLVFDPAGGPWRYFSLGTLAGAFGPFMSVLFHHIGKLQGNLEGVEGVFREVLVKSQARLLELSKLSRGARDPK